MTRYIRFLGVVATVTSMAATASGCTAVGYGIGAAIDAGNTQIYRPVSAQTWTVEPGREGQLYLRDGTQFEATYRGTAALPSAAYAAYYDRLRADLLTVHELPALGDVVRVVLTTGDTLDAPCHGFDYNRSGVDEEPATPNSRYRGLVVARDSTSNVIPFANVRDIHAADGASVAGSTLDSLTAAGVIPLRTGLVFEMSSGEQQVLPIGDIRGFEVKSNTGRTVGAVVGLITDAAIIAGAIAFSQSDWLNISLEEQRLRR